jgi:type II secretory pathway pseudopilin PulG
MVELLVVVIIIAILLGLAFSAVRSSRATGRTLGSLSAAHAYGNAIDQFARDHRGRYPRAPGSPDWPTNGPNGTGGGPAADVLGQRRYYLRSVPESIQDGTVTFGSGGPARLSYRQVGGGKGYELTLTVDGRPPCVVRGGDVGGSAANECGRR